MPRTFTTHYNFVKPEIGSVGVPQWSVDLNDNFDAIDAKIKDLENLIGDLDPEIPENLESRLAALEAAVANHESRITALEQGSGQGGIEGLSERVANLESGRVLNGATVVVASASFPIPVNPTEPSLKHRRIIVTATTNVVGVFQISGADSHPHELFLHIMFDNLQGGTLFSASGADLFWTDETGGSTGAHSTRPRLIRVYVTPKPFPTANARVVLQCVTR